MTDAPGGAGTDPPSKAGTAAPRPASWDRTVLAWHRTGFALLAGAAVLSRLTADRLGPASVAGLVVVAVLVLWMVGAAVADARRRTGDYSRGRDGHRTAALCAGIVVVGLTELAAVLLGGAGADGGSRG